MFRPPARAISLADALSAPATVGEPPAPVADTWITRGACARPLPIAAASSSWRCTCVARVCPASATPSTAAILRTLSGAGCRSSITTAGSPTSRSFFASSVWRRRLLPMNSDPCRLRTPSTPVVRLNRNWCGAARPASVVVLVGAANTCLPRPSASITAMMSSPPAMIRLLSSTSTSAPSSECTLLGSTACCPGSVGTSLPATRCQPAGSAPALAAAAAGAAASGLPADGGALSPQAASTNETAIGSAHWRRREAMFMQILLAGRAAGCRPALWLTAGAG